MNRCRDCATPVRNRTRCTDCQTLRVRTTRAAHGLRIASFYPFQSERTHQAERRLKNDWEAK